MTTFGATCIVTALLSFGFGVFIALNRKRSPNDSPIILWVSFCFAVASWSFGLGMMTMAQTQLIATHWLRVHYFGAILIPTLYLHFILAFLQKKSRYLLTCIYLLTALFQALSFANQLAAAVPKPPFNYYTAPGRFYDLYSLFFFLCVVYGHALLFKTVRKTTGFKRNQIYFLFLGTAIGFGGGSTAFFPVYNIPIFPFGVPFTAVYVFIVGYSILIYRLMDFNLLMRWGLAFGTSFSIITIVFVTLVAALEYFNRRYIHLSVGFPSIIAACFVVLVFDPIRKRMTRWIDRIVFKSPDFQLMLMGIEEELRKAGSLDSITSGLSSHLKRILNTSHCGFVMWNPSAALFELFPLNAFQGKPIVKMSFQITQTDFLVRTIETERRLFKYGIVTEDELNALGNRAHPGERTTFWKMRRTLRWLGGSITVPLMLNAQLIGFVVLGTKNDNSLYNEQDRKFLAHVSDIVSMVVKNHVIGFPVGNLSSTPKF